MNRIGATLIVMSAGVVTYAVTVACVWLGWAK